MATEDIRWGMNQTSLEYFLNFSFRIPGEGCHGQLLTWDLDQDRQSAIMIRIIVRGPPEISIHEQGLSSFSIRINSLPRRYPVPLKKADMDDDSMTDI